MSSGQQVLLKLRKMIISGELEGGARIAEIPTAELLGVSRQPVRIAFRLLEQEGLLIKTQLVVTRFVKFQNNWFMMHSKCAVCSKGWLQNFGRTRLKRRAEKTLQHCIQETENF